jgi:ADP-ribosylglycohydrolase
MAAIRARCGELGVTGYLEYREECGRRFAPFSDDTQLALVVLDALRVSCEMRADLDATMSSLAQAFMRWATSPKGGHRNPGAACLAGCAALAAGRPWYEAGQETAGGCGSVMRVYPFALVFQGDPERAESWAVAHSKLTHRSPMAFAACAAFVRGLLALLGGGSTAELGQAMARAAEPHDPETARRIRDALSAAARGELPSVVLKRHLGWAAHDAVAAACYVFTRHPDDPRRALLEAVNSPGDSDSIGTLVGALMGARHGLGNLPAEWVREVEQSSELLALASEVEALVLRQRLAASPNIRD